MNIELTKDAQRAAAKIYKSYLEKISNGSSKASAREFSYSEIDSVLSDESPDDVELIKEELINTFSMKTNILDDLTLSSSFISYMENRFKNGIKEVLNFLSQFIP